jgi:hypothetical protein
MRLRTKVAAALAASATALALAGGIGAAAKAQSSSAAVGRVDRAHLVARWRGGPFEVVPGLPAISNPRPEVCAVNCERRSLQLDLPPSTWKLRDDGVLIAIHWDDSAASDLNLFVYDPSGRMVGSSDGLDTDGETVFLPHPANGVYELVITATYMTTGTVSYRGEARVRPDLATGCNARPCALLPRLRTVPPSDFHVDGIPPVPSTQLGFPIPFGPALPGSCYPDEAGAGSHRCLRFANQIQNIGAGPLKMRFEFLGAGPEGARVGFVDCRMEQVIERSDGTDAFRNAGPCVFHTSHGHFHYSNFAEFSLHRVLRNGRTDPAVLRKSSKRGFCLTDGRNFAFGTSRNSGRGYWFPNCNLPDRSQLASQASTGAVWNTMGISPGWGDVYSWDTPDQYIEITGVPDGLYDVVSTANPDGGILESMRGDDTARTRICLKANTVKVMAPGAKASVGCR